MSNSTDERFEIAEEGESSSHWTESIGNGNRCLNCDTPISGDYCENCGQRHLGKRLSFGSLSKRIFSELSSIDRGFLHTFVAMFKNPGGIARDYIVGRQKPYVNPLTYFLFGAASQLLGLFVLKGYMEKGVREGLAAQFKEAPTEELEKMQKVFGGDPATVFAESYFNTIQNTYTYGALFFMCMPLALFLMLTHRIAGEKFRLGETLIFSLYIIGHTLFLTAIVNLIFLPLAPSIQPLMAIGTYFLFILYAHRPFFEAGIFSRAMTFLSILGASFVFIVALLTIFLISLMLKILMIKYFG